jgi:hypothetical protein
MKKFLSVLIASFALVMIQGFGTISADGGGGISLSKGAGKYSSTLQGSLTFCFKPGFLATENCSTVGAIPVPLNVVVVGQGTQDKDGDSCTTYTSTSGTPGSPVPPSVGVGPNVSKVTNYDPATGSGDGNYTNYAGGKCIGFKFNSAGATVVNFGTFHFVYSDDAVRTDFVVTSATDAVGDIGAFNLPGVNLKQK